MTDFKVEDGIDRPDDLYQALVDAHEGLSEAESRALNARLILLLANHIGAADVASAAARMARESVLRDRD